jgi:ribosomal protein L11 methyltransferase
VADAASGSAAERPVFAEPGASPPRGWQRNRVSALVVEGADPAALVAAACARAGIARAAHEVHPVAEQDWVRASRDQFQPIRISPRLWIVPSWHEPPDPSALNIVLDPGLAFGTGGHATTGMCLAWLEAEVRGGEAVIDYGCGSGILAIAAMKLGARCADAVDIDAQALLAARANARQNRVHVAFHDAAATLEQPAEIVIANILARPLIVLAPLIARITAPGGRLALAGLLEAQGEEVAAAYRPWFDIGAGAREQEWLLLCGTRRAP